MPLQESTGSPKKNVQAPTDSPKENAQVSTEQLDLSPQHNILTQRQARQLLAEQDYVGTINLIHNEIRKGMDEQFLAEEFIQATNGSLGQAKTLMQQGSYQRAALILKTVQENYPKNLKLQRQVSASPAQLTDQINLCTEELMEAGLVAYRSGELATAIDVWEQVLKFNPGHQAAQNSIQTAQLQLSNLKSMDSNN